MAVLQFINRSSYFSMKSKYVMAIHSNTHNVHGLMEEKRSVVKIFKPQSSFLEQVKNEIY